jgi:hypothetical protein
MYDPKKEHPAASLPPGACLPQHKDQPMPKDTANIGAVAPRIKPVYQIADPAWLQACLELGVDNRFSDIAVITPEMALLILGLNTHNRPVQSLTVDRYRDLITDGKWRLSIEAIGFSYDGVLINGQHRLLAIIEAGIPVAMTCWFGCEPEEFEVIDVPKIRTPADSVSTHGYNHANTRTSLARHMLRAELRTRSHPSVLVIAKVKAMANENIDTALKAGDRIYHHRVITRSAGVLAYYWIEKHTKHLQKLPDFWDHLSHGGGMQEGALILKLRNWMCINGPKIIQDRAFKEAAYVTLAWNVWIKGNRKLPPFEWPHTLDLPDVD